ncbi:putative PEP-binding protein, partial [Bartonella sp. MR168JLCBS]|uniref:putative PEP-binding protein n=1 Tax=Bartonella sp. MR168JLCBS TaxID=3243556 RepID=UPI0035CEE544
KTDAEILDVAAIIGVSPEVLAERAQQLHEFNPMLGLRGCRLAITYPEIVEMQARAIFEAAAEAAQKSGSPVMLEIMVPLVALKSELDFVKAHIDQVACEVMKEKGSTIQYMVGTMIELPRAALRADEIAKTAEFFSFGTNDLTQTTFGISRDDAAPFLETYFQKGLLEQDPFVSIDRDGVGELISIAVQRGRSQRAKIKLGICGEHGGDPASIALCEENDLDYVSCSPFRVPIARLAAAQSAIAKKT